MTVRITQSVRVSDSSAVADARRTATHCAEAVGLSESLAGRAALVATELATNLLKHTDGGSLLFGSDDANAKAITITSVDKGEGIANVQVAMRDGYSTAGSQGQGLGAVNRSSISVAVYTLAGKGTVIHCVVGDEAVQTSPLVSRPRFSVAGVGVPMKGETANGDAWSSATIGDTITIGVADGLGHGPLAATASLAAARVFATGTEAPLERLMQDAHGAMRSTRGAAVGIARILLAHGRVEFMGIGNIAGTIVSDAGSRKVVSLPGIVGLEMRKLQTFSYPWDASSVLVLQSDGVSASWSVPAYPGLMQHEPAAIAAVLFRDHCRGTDDATIVVAKAS
ncbi:MAG TPA: SpoIIE family protein phosphatase [Thermoanaerobaculia bacterium]|nr:SpoIIE family protein phosphatase [Thermoanaerobaculia bacterium]